MRAFPRLCVCKLVGDGETRRGYNIEVGFVVGWLLLVMRIFCFSRFSWQPALERPLENLNGGLKQGLYRSTRGNREWSIILLLHGDTHHAQRGLSKSEASTVR